MIVAGVGCRKGALAADIEAVITAALVRAGITISQLRLVATSAAKGGEPSIAAAAAAIGVPLVLIPHGELAAAGPRAVTRSERVIALAGVPSVAEAAALAAGGPGARLIAPRIAVGPVTCALADIGRAIAYSAAASSPSPLVGEGRGGGSGDLGKKVPHRTTPTPDPSPQGGGEKKRCPATCDSPTDTGEAS